MQRCCTYEQSYRSLYNCSWNQFCVYLNLQVLHVVMLCYVWNATLNSPEDTGTRRKLSSTFPLCCSLQQRLIFIRLCKEFCINKSLKPLRLLVGAGLLKGQSCSMSSQFFNIILVTPTYCFYRLFPKMTSGYIIVSDLICYSNPIVLFSITSCLPLPAGHKYYCK